jgi:predicted TIM-barrel fold metal-dependent hydrolase
MAKHTKPHVHPVDEAWLALSGENPIEPDIDIVDSHIHLWDFSDPPYYSDTYIRDAKSAGISTSIYVDCTMAYRENGPAALEPVGEVEFACSQANASSQDVSVAAGIIGWADLTLGNAAGPVLDALEIAGGGHFRGVRTRATYDPDPLAGYGANGIGPGHILRDDYRQGVEQLHARGHALDIYAFHTQLHEVADLARAFPDLPIILNHIGGPLGVGRYADIGDQVFADWAAGMAEVATCPNVLVKIGGFAISRIAIVPLQKRERPYSSVEVADLCKPWVDHCLAIFGAQRCMFGSNFPVDKVAMPMLTLVNAMKHLTEHLPKSDRLHFFASNARRIYKI